MCSLFLPALAGLALVPPLTIGIMRDFSRLKTKWEKRKTPPAPNHDQPLVNGSGPTLLGHSASDLRAEVARLRQHVNLESQKPQILWVRFQEVRQALQLKLAFGNAAVWPGEEPKPITANPDKPTLLRRMTTAVAVRSNTSDKTNSVWRR